MKKVTCFFYTFDEFRSLLRRAVFVNGEHFGVEIVDTYFWRIALYDPDLDLGEDDDDLHMSDFDTLPALSKLLGMKLENTHASHDGIWLEGVEMIQRTSSSRRKKPKG